MNSHQHIEYITMDTNQQCKALDIVKDQDGDYGMVTQTKDGGAHATIRYFETMERKQLWIAVEDITVVNSFARLLAVSMDYGYGVRGDAGKVFGTSEDYDGIESGVHPVKRKAKAKKRK